MKLWSTTAHPRCTTLYERSFASSSKPFVERTNIVILSGPCNDGKVHPISSAFDHSAVQSNPCDCWWLANWYELVFNSHTLPKNMERFAGKQNCFLEMLDATWRGYQAPIYRLSRTALWRLLKNWQNVGPMCLTYLEAYRNPKMDKTDCIS